MTRKLTTARMVAICAVVALAGGLAGFLLLRSGTLPMPACQLIAALPSALCAQVLVTYSRRS